MTTERQAIADAKRVVVKIGSSSLTTVAGGLDQAAVGRLVETISDVLGQGRQVVVVTSGAIAGSLDALGLKTRPRDLATQQAAASVGQVALLSAYQAAFARRGYTAGQVLLTAEDMIRRGQYRNAQRTLYRLMEMGAVPVVNENDTVATAELRFGDNDRLAALVAHLVHAEALILLSDVAGLFSGPPNRPESELIHDVRSADDVAGIDVMRPGSSGVGSGGMRTKVEAAQIASRSGIPVVLTQASAASQALSGEPVGTYFHKSGRRESTRRLWLRYAATTHGGVVLDEGAVLAITERGKSLLSAGVCAVKGEFAAGDPIDLIDQTGRTVGRGLVNFDSAELPDLMGRTTQALAKEFGSAYERELVHRDDLVVMAD